MPAEDPIYRAGENVVALDTVIPDRKVHRRQGAPSPMEGIRPIDLQDVLLSYPF